MPTEGRWRSQVTDLTPLVASTMGTHAVQLYEKDAFLTDLLARVVEEGLAAGDAVVAIATPRHRQAVEERLRASGCDVDAAREGERYVAKDAADVLAAIQVDDVLDEPRFTATIGGMLDRAARTTTHGRIRVFGEMVALLWSAGERAQALALEQLWNHERARRRNFSLLCAYPLAVFGAVDDTPRFTAMCGHHTHVVPAESYGELDNAGERLRAIAELQQRAVVLEGETAHSMRSGVRIVCKRCNRMLLMAHRIGQGEGDAIAAHLREEHAGVLAVGVVTLGALLREVRVITS